MSSYVDDNYVYEEQQLCSSNTNWGKCKIKEEKNILNDLVADKFSLINMDVKKKANNIFMSMKGQSSRKGSNKIQLMYYCVYCAYLELDIPFSPIEIADLFELDLNQTSKCGSMFSEINTGYAPPKDKTVKVWYYFPNFCAKIGLTQFASNEMTELYHHVVSKNPNLLEHKPHSIASGIFKYYLTIKGVVLEDKYQLVNITRLSSATIRSIEELISEADNNI